MDKIERNIILDNGFKLNLDEIYPKIILDKLDELIDDYKGLVEDYNEIMEWISNHIGEGKIK